MTTNQIADNKYRSFSSAFFSAHVAAMTEACGSPWMMAAAPDENLPTDASEHVRMKLMLGGTLRGEFVLELHRADAALLASKLLQQPMDKLGAEQTAALLKLLEATMSKFRTALEPEFGTFTITASPAAEPPSDRANIFQATFTNDDANRVSASMVINPALKEALFLHSQAASTVAGARRFMKDAAGNALPEPANLDLVMDVELNVTLRFGQRQLTLREVMELTSGSVVELDRQVEEPVELLLNGMVIARGEAVVIDGNYGLRVTEVSQPVSSLTLH
jgi:flagellar motor switch protein FliN/FliY